MNLFFKTTIAVSVFGLGACAGGWYGDKPAKADIEKAGPADEAETVKLVEDTEEVEKIIEDAEEAEAVIEQNDEAEAIIETADEAEAIVEMLDAPEVTAPDDQ